MSDGDDEGDLLTQFQFQFVRAPAAVLRGSCENKSATAKPLVARFSCVSAVFRPGELGDSCSCLSCGIFYNINIPIPIPVAWGGGVTRDT